MTGVESSRAILSFILDVANLIVKLVDAAQRNKEKCKLLGERVKMIILLLEELQTVWTPDSVTNRVLQDLNDALNEGKALVESCQAKRTWSRVFKTQKKAKKFDVLDTRITKILEMFHLANMILIVRVNMDRFFENVLDKLLRDGACRRLPQSVKEELKSSAMRLTNTQNMSSDAQTMLERIKMDITDRSAAGTSRLSESQGRHGGEKASRVDNLKRDVISVANFIVGRAKEVKQNRDKIQLLAEVVKQVAELMQHPQSSELLWDPNTESKVNGLKRYLEKAKEIIEYNGKQHTSVVPRAILCGVDINMRDYPDDTVLMVAYKIEYYVHVLTMHLLHINGIN